MSSTEYPSVVLDGENIRYAILNDQPYLNFRDVERLLDHVTTMSHYIAKLHLEKDGGYYLLPARKNSQQRLYFVSVPVMFKIINNITTRYHNEGALVLKDFCEKTFGIQCKLTEREVKLCCWCGGKIPPPKWGEPSRTKFCSNECRRQFYNQKNHDRWFAQKAERTVPTVCPNCGKTFETTSSRQIYCCKACGMIRRAALLQEKRKHPTPAKSAFYNPREVYHDIKEPAWGANFTW